jgi:hypothetical protein
MRRWFSGGFTSLLSSVHVRWTKIDMVVDLEGLDQPWVRAGKLLTRESMITSGLFYESGRWGRGSRVLVEIASATKGVVG